MPRPNVVSKLQKFADQHRFRTKGPLCVALVMTRIARDQGMPLNPENLLTERSGQVRGLGKGAVQKILTDHGIQRLLASEGGRTSRGSIDNMKAYVDFLNDLAGESNLDFQAIESFWVDEVRKFFAGKPFQARYDASRSLREIIRDLLEQASERQKSSGGTMYVGAMLQHLVGAKLDRALGEGSIEHHGASTSDEQTGRAGDFLLGEAAIHVTTAPTEALLRRCRENLDQNFRPIIVTLPDRIAALRENAKMAGILERIDFFDIEQFLSLNLYEFAKFEPAARKVALGDVIERYNEIINEHETDPSLCIVLK